VLRIKRCPAFVNTFNHSHEFVQLSLVLNPATFTNIDSYSTKPVSDVKALNQGPEYPISSNFKRIFISKKKWNSDYIG
jgi:hypothetical protein